MIVKCNACESKYRVNQDKLPPGGGNIQCPGCGNIFFVAPPEASGAGQLQALPVGSTAAEEDDFAATQVGSIPPQLLATASPDPDLDLHKQESKGKGKESEKWRLKTNFGLVYDFPDTQSLQSWLLAREDLDGYQLSRGGSDFKAIDTYKEVMNPALRAKLTAAAVGLKPKKVPESSPRPLATSAETAPRGKLASSPEVDARGRGGATGGGKPTSSPGLATAGKPASTPAMASKGRSTAGRPVVTAPHLRPQSESNSSRWLLIGLLVVVIAGAFGLQIGGVVDFRKLYSSPPPPSGPAAPQFQTRPPTQPTAQPTASPTPTVGGPRTTPTEPVAPRPFGSDEHLGLLLEQGRKELQDREYEKAVATLQGAANLAPTHPEVFLLLEKAYSRTGNREEARKARDRYRELSAAAQAPAPVEPTPPVGGD